MLLPVGVDYIPSGLTSIETKDGFVQKGHMVQCCLNCLESGSINIKSGFIICEPWIVCEKKCDDCTGEVCEKC